MANITLTIPDAQLARVIDGICLYYNYAATILTVGGGSSVPNPETKAQFAKRMLIEQTKIWIATVEGSTAQKTSYDTALSQITIT